MLMIILPYVRYPSIQPYEESIGNLKAWNAIFGV